MSSSSEADDDDDIRSSTENTLDATEGDVSLDEVLGRCKTFLSDYKSLESHMQRELFLREPQIAILRKTSIYIAALEGSIAERDYVRYHGMPSGLLRACAKLVRAIVDVKEARINMFGHVRPALLLCLEFFLRVYNATLSFSPVMVLRPILECFVAQSVELVALLSAGRALRNSAQQNELQEELVPIAEHIADLGAQATCLLRGDFLVDTDMCLPLEDVSQTLLDLDRGSHDVSLTSQEVVTTIEAIERHAESLKDTVRRARDAFTEAYGEQLYMPLNELLLSADWGVVEAICLNKYRAPDEMLVVRPLYAIFKHSLREMDLVHWAIDQDVRSGVREANTLFRTPTTATRLLRIVFYSQEGREYLKFLLLPLIKKAFKARSLEVDSKRIVPSDDIDVRKNVRTLIAMFEDLVQHILKSINVVPTSIRKFLLYARNTVIGQANVKDSTLLVVASLFFLRFVCPALVTPQAYGLIDEVPEMEQQRALILVSKMLQNCASGVEFDGSKEDYMVCFNDVVTKYREHMATFYEGLISATEIGKAELKAKKPVKRLSSNLMSAKRKARLRQEALMEKLAEEALVTRSLGLMANELATHADTVKALRGKPLLSRAHETARGTAKVARKMWRHASECRVLSMLNKLLQRSDTYGTKFRLVVAQLGPNLPSDMLSDEQRLELMQQLEDGAPSQPYSTSKAGDDDDDDDDRDQYDLKVCAMLADRLTMGKPRREYKRAKRVAFLATKVVEQGEALESLLKSSAVRKGSSSSLRGSSSSLSRPNSGSDEKNTHSSGDDERRASYLNAQDDSSGAPTTLRTGLASARSGSQRSAALIIKATDLVVPQTLGFARYIVYLLRRLRELEVDRGSELAVGAELGAEVQAELAAFTSLALMQLNTVILASKKERPPANMGALVGALTNGCLVVTDRVLELLNLLRESNGAVDQRSESTTSIMSMESPRLTDEEYAQRNKQSARTYKKLSALKRPSMVDMSAALSGMKEHPLASLPAPTQDAPSPATQRKRYGSRRGGSSRRKGTRTAPSSPERERRIRMVSSGSTSPVRQHGPKVGRSHSISANNKASLDAGARDEYELDL